MLNTTNWKTYPFTVDGVNFISKLDPKGSIYKTVEKLPNGVFASMNTGAIKSMIGNPSTISRSELQDELNRVNEGATQALICLE